MFAGRQQDGERDLLPDNKHNFQQGMSETWLSVKLVAASQARV